MTDKAIEALKPFAAIQMGIEDDDADSDEWFRHDGDCLTVGDFRRARAALAAYEAARAPRYRETIHHNPPEKNFDGQRGRETDD